MGVVVATLYDFVLCGPVPSLHNPDFILCLCLFFGANIIIVYSNICCNSLLIPMERNCS